MVLRSHFWKEVLIVLVIIGTTLSQAESFSSHHSQEHASHCCGVCHIGHLSFLDSGDGFGFTPPSVLYWHDPAEHATRVTDSQAIRNLSRAPPE